MHSHRRFDSAARLHGTRSAGIPHPGAPGACRAPRRCRRILPGLNPAWCLLDDSDLALRHAFLCVPDCRCRRACRGAGIVASLGVFASAQHDGWSPRPRVFRLQGERAAAGPVRPDGLHTGEICRCHAAATGQIYRGSSSSAPSCSCKCCHGLPQPPYWHSPLASYLRIARGWLQAYHAKCIGRPVLHPGVEWHCGATPLQLHLHTPSCANKILAV